MCIFPVIRNWHLIWLSSDQDDRLPKPDREKSLFEVPLPQDMEPQELMIVDSTGRGIAGATVEFATIIKIEGVQKHRDWPGATVTTNENGRFMLPQELWADESQKASCRMIIRADGFQSRHVGTGAHRLRNEPRIDLLRVSSIKGRILGNTGQPLQVAIGLGESLTSHVNPRTSSSRGASFDRTFQNGVFEFENIPEGIHLIRYSYPVDKKHPSVTGKVVAYTQDGRDVEGFTIDLRQAVCGVRGRVLDSQGKPVSKATVRLQKEIKVGLPHGMTIWPVFAESERTNRKGEYVMENIMPGVYEIEAVLDGKQRKVSEKKTIGLSGDNVAEIDLRLK